MDFTNTTKNPVVLSEKNRRFALDPGSGIHGYIRLQTDGDRGIITATAENLKVFPHGEYTYKLIFTGVKKKNAAIIWRAISRLLRTARARAVSGSIPPT